MVSSEFKSVVAEKNLLRTRIMLKDSFVIDPTFIQLSEMLSYAKTNLPNLMVNYDGDYLEEDSSKWTPETMNEELVQLVTNFSDIRISHLKKVVSKVLAKEAISTRNSVVETSDSKETKRKEALRKMSEEAKNVNEVLLAVYRNHKRWKLKNIDDLEQAAEEILKAVHTYRANR